MVATTWTQKMTQGLHRQITPPILSNSAMRLPPMSLFSKATLLSLVLPTTTMELMKIIFMLKKRKNLRVFFH